MQIEIPDGAFVHLTIGHAPPMLALPHDPTGPGAEAAYHRPVPPSPAAPRRPRYGLLAVAGLVLLIGGFTYGRTSAGRPQLIIAAGPAHAAVTPGPAPMAEQHAFPEFPVQHAPAAAADGPATQAEVPANFAQQLRAPPTVTPPPGQPSSAPATAGGADGFGLHQ